MILDFCSNKIYENFVGLVYPLQFRFAFQFMYVNFISSGLIRLLRVNFTKKIQIQQNNQTLIVNYNSRLFLKLSEEKLSNCLLSAS